MGVNVKSMDEGSRALMEMAWFSLVNNCDEKASQKAVEAICDATKDIRNGDKLMAVLSVLGGLIVLVPGTMRESVLAAVVNRLVSTVNEGGFGAEAETYPN